MLSPLQLKDYRLIKLSLDANEDFNPEDGKEGAYEVVCGYKTFKAENKPSFWVVLDISVKAKKQKRYCAVKKVTLKIGGVFDFPEDTSEEKIDDMVPYNCIAILYGISRGIVADLTGNIQGGKFILPVVSLADMINKQVKLNKPIEIKE